MTESQRINQLYKKFAALEPRIGKLEDGLQELDRVVDPEGWIGEAFDCVVENIDELKTEMSRNFDEVNGKIDTILSHITGLNKDN